MKPGRARLGLLAGVLCLWGCAPGGSLLDSWRGSSGLSLETVVAGLKEALRVGTGNTVARTSKEGGYWENIEIRIPMPAELERLGSTLRRIGLGGRVDAFERRMNEAAEHAAKEAAPVFIDAIKGMTFEDARGILRGSETAATDYFRAKTTGPLRKLYAPIVRRHMEKLGVVTLYNELLERYLQLPLAPRPRFSLEEYVVDRALAGLFRVLAGEERRIREDPAARTTELLRKVFGRP